MNLMEMLAQHNSGPARSEDDRVGPLLNPDVDEKLLLEAYARYAEEKAFAPGDVLQVIPSLNLYGRLAENQSTVFVRWLGEAERRLDADGDLLDCVIAFRGENCCGAMHAAVATSARFEKKREVEIGGSPLISA